MKPYQILLVVLGSLLLLISLSLLLRYFKYKKGRDLQPDRHKTYLNSLKSKVIPENAPNVIIVFMDDMGFGDISCFGSQVIKTPNIDNLALNGARFTHFYSSAPVCSASRAGILTGRFPIRSHVPGVFFPTKSMIARLLKHSKMNSYGMEGIAPDEVTLAEVMQSIGYSTGMLGKWHLGDYSPHLPNDKGFDFFYGTYYSNDMKPYAFYRNSEKVVEEPVNQNETTKLLTKEAVNFISENHDKPFFLHYCQPFPHNPVHASETFRGNSLGGLFGDCVEEVDWSIGEITKTLQKYGILENTIIIITSDNGPWYEGNPGFNRGRKGLTYEGGQKVPMIAHWPQRIPEGLITEEMAMNIDIFPSILDILRIPLPNDRIIDGKSIIPLMTKEKAKSPHEFLYYFWGKRLQAVRDASHKYHIKKASDISSYWFRKVGPFLYEMKKDNNESYNQLDTHPDIGERLKDELETKERTLKENLRGWI